MPVVHSVGGLRDTVKPFNPFEKSGTGEQGLAAAACRLLLALLPLGQPPAPALLLRSSPPHMPAARHIAGWTFEMADAGRFRNALGDALYTFREHRDSFRCGG